VFHHQANRQEAKSARAMPLGAASWLDSLAWSLTLGRASMGLVSRARRIAHPSITDVAVLMRMGCQEGRGMFLDPWPTLNLHVHFPKRAHHQPMGLGWGAVTDSSFSPLSHLNSITAHDALHRGDCPALRVRVMAEDSHRQLLQGSRCSKSRGQRALSINCVRKKGSCADVRASNNVPVAGPSSHRFMMMTAVWGPLRDGNLATGLRS